MKYDANGQFAEWNSIPLFAECLSETELSIHFLFVSHILAYALLWVSYTVAWHLIQMRMHSRRERIKCNLKNDRDSPEEKKK